MTRNKQPVSLNIKNPEVYQAVARPAKLQGATMTAAEFARHISALPLLDARSDDEILGNAPEGYLIGD